MTDTTAGATTPGANHGDEWMPQEAFYNPERGARAVPSSEGAEAAAREVRLAWNRDSAFAGGGGLSQERTRGERPDTGVTGFTMTDGGAITTYNPNQRLDRLSSVETRNGPDGAQMERRFEGNPRGLVSELIARDRAGNVTVTESFQDGHTVTTEKRNDGTVSTRTTDAQGRVIQPGTSVEANQPGTSRLSPQNPERPGEVPGAERRAGRAENRHAAAGADRAAERSGHGHRRGAGHHEGHGRRQGHGRHHRRQGHHQQPGGHEGPGRRQGNAAQGEGHGPPQRHERNRTPHQSRLNTHKPHELFKPKKAFDQVQKLDNPDDTTIA